MKIDSEGHICVSPREICERIDARDRLINDVLIPGTPAAFPTFMQYRDFLGACADQFGIHPENFQIRGSTKLGFSIAPHADSAWSEMRPDSDLDLAIVDPDYYHYLDREIRHWERMPENQVFYGRKFTKRIDRRKQRQFYTLRFFDFPEIGCVKEHNARLKKLPIEECCGMPRPVDAFVFRDWWSLQSRWDFDLRDLKKAIDGGLATGGDEPLKLDDQ